MELDLDPKIAGFVEQLTDIIAKTRSLEERFIALMKRAKERELPVLGTPDSIGSTWPNDTIEAFDVALDCMQHGIGLAVCSPKEE